MYKNCFFLQALASLIVEEQHFSTGTSFFFIHWKNNKHSKNDSMIPVFEEYFPRNKKEAAFAHFEQSTSGYGKSSASTAIKQPFSTTIMLILHQMTHDFWWKQETFFVLSWEDSCQSMMACNYVRKTNKYN